MQKGQQRLMVGSLDGRYRSAPSALVRARQALLGHAEPGGSRAQPGEIAVHTPCYHRT